MPHPSDESSPTADPAAAPPRSDAPWVDLAAFDNSDYETGRDLLLRTLWYYVSLAIFECGWLPVSSVKTWILRKFGARIGEGLVIKPHVRIKYPWRLKVGNHCWIGQGVWIDNIADVEIGDHVCVSQLAYLCTGSHDHRRKTFDLAARPIRIGHGAWLGARATVLPGASIGANAILAGGSVATKDVPPGVIAAGVPARPIAERTPPTA